MRSKTLRAQRAKLISDASALINGENVTPEQTTQFDAMMTEADKIKGQIDRIEAAEAANAELAQNIAVRADNNGIGTDEQRDREAREIRVFGAWLRGGVDGISAEDRAFATAQVQRGADFQAAQGTQPGTAGGYLAPPQFMEQLLVALKSYFTGLNLFSEIRTGTGADITWPTNDDTASRARIIGENQQIGTKDLTFGTTSLKAFLYATDAVLVPWTLMQDSFLDLDAFLRSAFATRFGRTLADDLTIGTGSGMPQGVCTAATVGVTTNALTITNDDIIDLQHSVNKAYRQGAVFMMNDASFKVLRKLKDAQGRPLWSQSLETGAPDTFAGANIEINESMPDIAKGNKAVLYGNFSNYKFRIVKDMSVVRLNERYADYLQTAFFAYGRYGGGLPTNAAAIQALQTGAGG